jgi:tape measure domain-containing protein
MPPEIDNMTDLRARIIISSDDNTRAGFNSVREGLNQLNQRANHVIGSIREALGVAVGAALVKQLIDVADGYKTVSTQIKLAAGESADYEETQKRILEIANNSNSALEDTSRLYARSSEALKNIGTDQETVLKFTEAVSLSMKASSSNTAEASSTVTQLTQAISTSAVQWSDFGQLADTNLKLVNVAAKNLGYDGIGELKQAMEDGEISNVALVNSIVKGFDEIKQAADATPPTVSGAFNVVRNNLTVYIGDLDKAEGGTAKLASVIQFLGENIRFFADVALDAAKIYGVVLVQRLAQSTVAFFNNAGAARAAAAAQLQLTQAQIRQTQVMVAGSAYLIRSAELQLRLAATELQRISALRALDAAYAKHRANTAALEAQQAQLNQLTRQGTLGMLLFGGAVGFVGKAIALVTRLGLLLIAVDIAKTVYEWASSFDTFRRYMILVGATAEQLMIILSNLWGLLFNLDEVGQKLDANAKKWGDLYFAVGKSADGQSAKVQQAAEAHKAAWQKVEESIKNLTTLSDEQFARQNADLQRHLDERLAAIDASEAQEQEKDAQRAEALTQSAQAEIDLAKQTADEKLALLTLTYDRQIEKLANSEDRQRELERASIEKRKEIYSQLAQHYAAIVDRLAQEHDREVQAARAAAESLKQLAIQHEFELNDIQRAGANEYQKIQSEKFEFEQTLSAAKAEIDKGKAGDQDKINSLLERAHELTRDITSSEISLAETDSEVYAARSTGAQRLNELYDQQKTALENVQRAHEDNADILARKQEEALAKLEAVNTEINKIALKLERDYQLQINVDTQAVDAAIAKINSIPTEKTVTIHTRTVDDGAVAARQSGGPIFPIQRFEMGGFPRREGKLPGFGGGDKIPALLEAGEWIIRKEAVAKLGQQALQAINQGRLPIQRAEGGSAWDRYLGGLGKSQSFNTVATIRNFMFGRDAIQAAQRRLFELSEKALQGQIDKIKIDLNSRDFVAAFTPIAGPSDIRAINQRLQQLFESQVTALKTTKIKVPAPVFPNPVNSISPSAARSSASDSVTLRFQSPSGRTASVQSNKSEVANVLQVLKEAGAVTV